MTRASSRSKARRVTDFARQMAKAAEHNADQGGKATAKPAARRKPSKTSGKPPAFRKPQLATLVDAVPAGNSWMHEIKFDGYRALIAAAGDRWRSTPATARTGPTSSPRWSSDLGQLDLPPCLIDGEIIAPDKDGNPDFSTLQNVLKRGHGSQGADDLLEFHAFDLLELDGEDLGRCPISSARNGWRRCWLRPQPPIYVADHVIGAGEKLLRGDVRVRARKASSPSGSMRRYSSTPRQELGEGEMHPAAGIRHHRLEEIQRQGRGHSPRCCWPSMRVRRGRASWSTRAMSAPVSRRTRWPDLAARLKRLERKTPPAEVDRVSSRGVTWLTPKLVAEIAFSRIHRRRECAPRLLPGPAWRQEGQGCRARDARGRRRRKSPR